MVNRIESVLGRDQRRRQPVVKICGLKELSHARAAAEAGADMIGFVLAASRRRTTASAVRAIQDALRIECLAPLFVGVFVNASSDEINYMVVEAGLDAVQLSGDEMPNAIDDIHVPVIKAIRPTVSSGESELVRTADDWLNRARPAAALLFDAHVPGSYGGAGVLADWDAARLLSQQYPVLLAGGLEPANVGDAIGFVQPLGVDVSSGVEIAGAKHPDRIAAFVAAARAGESVASYPRGARSV